MKVSYSAPAKVILSGEHAVVYGRPALVSAIGKRLEFTIEESNRKSTNKNIKILEKIVLNFIQSSQSSCKITIDSDIPIGRGLGSSAAFSVAGIAAFLEFYSGKEHSIETINNLAYQAEKHFHQNPSGVDSSASCNGGLIFFRKEFEFLKGIYKLNFKIPKNIVEHLYLIDSGKPEESTADMVRIVGESYNKNPKIMEQTMFAIEKITKRMTVSIVKEDKNFFAQQISDNQKILEKIGVVSQTTQRLLEKLSSFGMGKIVGAGGIKAGSGYMLFYSERSKELEKFCKSQSILCMKFNQSHEGVKRV